MSTAPYYSVDLRHVMSSQREYDGIIFCNVSAHKPVFGFPKWRRYTCKTSHPPQIVGCTTKFASPCYLCHCLMIKNHHSKDMSAFRKVPDWLAIAFSLLQNLTQRPMRRSKS